MKPLPHTINGRDILLAVDFATRSMLVAEQSPTGRGEYYTSRHVRLTLDRAGVWQRQGPARSDYPKPDGPLVLTSDHAWHWRTTPVDRVVASYVPSHVVIDRSDLARTLDTIARINGKSLDVDGLLTVDVRADGLHLHGHGSARCFAVASGKGEPARDGLGRVVVLGELLRAVVKAEFDTNIVVKADVRGRALFVDDQRLWTAHVEPDPVAVPASETFDATANRLLTAAIRRAYPFASNDEARVNLDCVHLQATDGGVWISATDGHRAYRERVETPATFGTLKLPRQVLAALLRRKSASLWFAYDGARAYVQCYDLTVACAPDDTAFPPVEQVTTPFSDHGRDAIAARIFTSEQWKPIAAWFHARRKSEETVHVHVGHDDATVRLALDGKATVFGEASALADVGTLRSSGPATAVDRGFRVAYLAEAFAAFDDAEPLTLTVASSLDPLWLTQPNRTFAVMPVRL